MYVADGQYERPRDEHHLADEHEHVDAAKHADDGVDDERHDELHRDDDDQVSGSLDLPRPTSVEPRSIGAVRGTRC